MKRIDKKVLAAARAIGQEADRLGIKVYMVGGIVRDAILNRSNVDLDIVVDGDAIALARKIGKKKKVTTFPQFGTAKVVMRKDLIVDLAGFRKETYSSPGALPRVKLGTFMDDVNRRDFTINTLALSLNRNSFGEIIDLLDGLTDIKKKTVRILHDKSFQDDPTRILRAIRFEQRFGFTLAKRTKELIEKALVKKAVKTVSSQRYFTEFKKILCEDDPIKPLRRLKALGGLNFISVDINLDIAELKKIQSGVKKLNLSEGQWLYFFLLLLKNVDKKTIDKVAAHWGFTRMEQRSIRDIDKIKQCMQILGIKGLKRSDVFQILALLSDEAVKFMLITATNSIVQKRIREYLLTTSNVKLKISGEDVKRMSGLSGEKLGVILREVLYAKMDRRWKTKKDEICFLKKCCL